jgi:hypothetical protein
MVHHSRAHDQCDYLWHTLSLSFHLSPSLGPALTVMSGSELSVFFVLHARENAWRQNGCIARSWVRQGARLAHVSVPHATT